MSEPRVPFSVRHETQQATSALALLVAYVTVLAACQYISYEVRFDFLVPPEHQGERGAPRGGEEDGGRRAVRRDRDGGLV